MFFPESRVRVYLYGQAVDMRKSFDGLYAVARAAFPQDPTGGDLYVFVNRSGRQIKVLYFDRSGWCVWAKRLIWLLSVKRPNAFLCNCRCQ